MKFAPVVVTDVEQDIHKIITDLNLSCDLKITSVGKKIIAKTKDDLAKIIEVLDAQKINYFSHPNDDTKTFKAVLCGLPQVETTAIAESISTTYNITPIKIVMFNTNASSKLYLCHFQKSEVSMGILHNIKSVYHHVVSWQPFKPKNKGPTQCYKCCMYGHGISSCKRFPVCMLCGNSHLTTACTSITKTTENPAYKCFYCAKANLQHNHKANDEKCPFRAKYLATVDKARNKNKQQSKPNKNNGASQSSHSSSNGQYVKAPTPPPLTQSFAAATATATPSQSNQQQTPSTSTESNQHTDNNLWSFNEVAHLLVNSINELKKCKSKLDQLLVIANLLNNACN